MPRENLKRQLERLRAELSDASELDADTRAALEALASDIERTLEGDIEAEHHSMRERFEDATLRFETEHPRLARVLGEIADALAKIGV
ncbi:MAG: DUF4404 family protein [Gammaproteobacteria bacterium]|nr:DUF4404 domain-containing protein [Gammaproteobacteria bacterium]